MRPISILSWLVITLVLTIPKPAIAGLVNPGDLAFIGFNADGRDDFAIVLLADADAGTVVRLSDREWQGSSFNTGEGAVSWTMSQALTAGTVVIFSNIDNASNSGFGASSGTLSGALQFAVGGETLYAFTGPNTTTPTAFLGAISTTPGDFNGSTGTLTGTGLVQGSSAVLLPSGTRGAEYSGSRNSQSTFPDYLSLIGNPSQNWTTSTTNGTDVLPFSSQSFTIDAVATPEPATWTLALLGSLGIAAATKLKSTKTRRAGAALAPG